MRLLGLYRGASLLFLLTALAVFGPHGVLRDRLLFRSDPASLMLYALAAAFTLFAVLLPLWLVLRAAAPGLWARLNRAGLYLAAIVFITIFIVFALGFAGAQFSVGWILDIFERWYLLALVIAAAASLAAWSLWAERERGASLARVGLLARLLFGASLIAGPSLFALVNLRSAQPAPDDTPRHVVLLVLDGMPAQHLQIYNEAARRTRSTVWPPKDGSTSTCTPAPPGPMAISARSTVESRRRLSRVSAHVKTGVI